jgi:type VI secretion system secreted protein VgrG
MATFPTAHDAASSLLALFTPALHQQGRLLQMRSSLPWLSLIPERMRLLEALGQPFEISLQCLSPSAHLPLADLLGEQLSVWLLQPDGSERPWHAYVHQASQLGADGGLARYQLALRPWLSALGLRRNSCLFHDQSVDQILETVFADHHPHAYWRFELAAPLPVRPRCTQYRETDLAFAHRLLAEEGLLYRFEHLEGSLAEEADAAGHARHVMVIFDAEAEAPALGPLRFTGRHVSANLPGQRDSLTAFMVQHQVQANAVTLGSWDHQRLCGLAGIDSTAPLGALPMLEVYDGAGAMRFADPAAAQAGAERALAALTLGTTRYVGQGSARHLAAGSSFDLTEHPDADGVYTVLAVEHQCANNLGPGIASQLAAGNLAAEKLADGSTVEEDLERGSYTNQVHCAPTTTPLVPRHWPRPQVRGLQTATVVASTGHADEIAVEMDRDHRVHIRFPWQDASGDAPTSSTPAAGTWVRVALPWAGADWGAVLPLRIGAEVAVTFEDGDIDRPFVLGAQYNGQDTPPLAAGVDAGLEHPGVISGWHSTALDGAGFNQWVLDDATGQLRQRLHCSWTAAEIGIGHLIAQDTSARRGAWRGAGFEANTQGWAALRAGQGMLLSTTARAGTYGSAQGSQMDVPEAVAQLQAARDLGQRLSGAAQAAGAAAQPSHDDGQAVPQLITQIDAAQSGKLESNINGQDARHDPAGAREPTTPVPAFAQPVLVLDTPAALAQLSDAGIAHYAGQDLTTVAQGDIHLAAAHTASQASGATTSLYTHQGGIQVKAAEGAVSLRAHTDTLSLLADQEIQVLSVGDEITILAKTRIAFTGSDSSIVLEGGDITFTTPGTWTAKGGFKEFLGGANGAVAGPQLPIGLASVPPAAQSLLAQYDEQVVFKDAQQDSVEGRLRYKVRNTAEEQQTLKCNSPDRGETDRLQTPAAQPLEQALRFSRFKFNI